MKNSILLILLLLISSCQTSNKSGSNYAEYILKNNEVKNQKDLKPMGVGIESNDITAMTKEMVKDITESSIFLNKVIKPRIIVDSKYFINDSSSIINKDILTDRLRSMLIRSSSGKIIFVGRQNVNMVSKEKSLKQNKVVSSNSNSNKKILGADFRLTGRITSVDATNPQTGKISRFNQINFEIVSLDTSEIIWSNIYSFEKSGTDAIIYR